MRKSLFILIFIFVFSMIIAAPVIDGNLSDSDYESIADGNTQTAWGGMALDEVVYYADCPNEVLYVGIIGTMSTGDNNGIGLWLGFDEVSGGKTAGSSLGGTSDGGHYMGDTGNNDYAADFPVDYMFAMNTGESASIYVDVVEFSDGTGNGQYLGNSNQTGSSATGPGSDDVFDTNTITFACNNDGGSNHGFEISIPYGQLGVTCDGFMKAFSMIVSSSAYFSNNTAPGDPGVTDPGFNANFNTMSGGYYNSGDIDQDEPLPVTLSTFTSQYLDGSAILNWVTQSESNNLGWNIYRSASSDLVQAQQLNFELIPGAGTCTEPTSYSYEDETELIPEATYWYWLESVSGSGETENYGPITLNIPEEQEIPELPQLTKLTENYPNPFNPQTTIEFTIKEGETGTLSIYNLKGQKIVSESFVAGTHEFKWIADNNASGAYFYKLETESYSKINKMLMLK